MRFMLMTPRLWLTMSCLLATNMAPAADLTAFTEEWPPYNYSEHGEVKGIATDILRASCREARLACEIHVVPWARAYALAGRTPNTLVYTTARNAAREKEFLWVGPLFPRATWVFGRSGKEAEFHDVPSLAHGRIGVVRGEAAEQDLLNAGVPKSALRPDGSNSAVLRMLVGGWVDAMVDTEIGMAWNLQQQSIPAGEVVPLMKLSDGGAYYFALNRDSRPEIRDALQNALDKLQKNGTVAALKAAYSPAKK